MAPVSPHRLETRNGAYEQKFLLPEGCVAEVIAWAGEHLAADPHATAEHGEYAVETVYYDTTDLSVYGKRLGYQDSEFRLRRYGTEPLHYLEEKRKSRGWVSKVRTRVTEAELSLLEAASCPPDWAGAWFRNALAERQLAPSCQVAYRRLAREGESDGGPVRLTLDREIRCAGAAGLCPPRDLERGVFLPVTLLELKYRNELPRLFQGLVRTFGLTPAVASKYRRATETCVVGRE